MNSRRSVRSAVLLSLLGACATAPYTEPRPAPAAPASSGADAVAARAAPQDYTPTTMFSDSHADFLAKKDRYRPSFRISLLGMANAGVNSEAGSFDQLRLRFDGMTPMIVDPDSVVLLGAQAEARRYDFSARLGPRDETLGSVGAHVGFGTFVDQDTYVEGIFSPGIYSDFDGTLHSQDWQFFGQGLATLRFNEDVFVKLGVRTDQTFDDVPVYPLIGVSWVANDDWRFDLLAPQYAELTYQLDAATGLNVGVDIEGQEYRVRSGNTAFGRQSFDFQVQELRLYVGGTHRFDDHVSAFARVGGVVAGDTKFGLAASGGADQREGQLDPVLFFEVGMGWDF